MQRLNERQGAFAAAILDPELPVPAGLVGPDGEPSAKRFAVYRNNVVVGLVETLKAAFPAVRRIVGDAFFAAMARAYVSRHPPNSPIMLGYGECFADFVGTFEPARVLPYLSDVARLERAWVEAYHAPEAQPLDPAVFTAITPDDLPQIQFQLHPSVRVVRSCFPVVSIWQMNIEGGVATHIDSDAGGEDALVVRPVAEVEVRCLPPGAAEFIEALAAGASLVDAAKAALRDTEAFDLPRAISGLLKANMLVGYSLNDTPPVSAWRLV